MAIKLVLIVLLICSVNKISSESAGKIMCAVDSRSFTKEGPNKLTIADIEPALVSCTHLLFGYAGIDGNTNKISALNPKADLDLYRTITQLRSRFPKLKILLTVGGEADIENKEKYLTLLETNAARIAFINSVYMTLRTYEFDGINLAWEFPPNKPVKIRGTISSTWKKFKEAIGVTSGPVDPNSETHKGQFVTLCREMKNAFRTPPDNYILSMTVNPNVNSTLFFDIPAIINYLDFVILGAYDFQTPERNPKEADFPAPLQEPYGRLEGSNINAIVSHWLSYHAPPSKIILAIPTFGRTWALFKDSTLSGVPPIKDIEGPGAEGPETKTPGLLSWPEICRKINNNNRNAVGDDAPITKVYDPTKRFGTYAFRLPDDKDKYGIWIGYEDPDTAQIKANYARTKGLGGVALFDLSTDDMSGKCTGEKFPILKGTLRG